VTTVRVSACIVGGGPAGLMLGLLLAKRGAQVLVLEGHETFEREFRGEVLQPSTVHLPPLDPAFSFREPTAGRAS